MDEVRLNHEHHLISQVLLFRGCVAEDDLVASISPSEEEKSNINLERAIQRINDFHESSHMALQIDSYCWIDGKTYYGWICMANDEISKKSMISLSKKQLKFCKIVIKISLANGGLISLNAAIAVKNRNLSQLQIL